MSVIAFPPTPQKTPTVIKEGEGISSQILPLSRLSMSGSNCSTSPILIEAEQRNSYSSPPPGNNDFTNFTPNGVNHPVDNISPNKSGELLELS
jgi:hypothetical protein